MTPPVQAYRPENHQDFDRLYTETYRRVFATLVVVLRNPDAAEDAGPEGVPPCVPCLEDLEEGRPRRSLALPDRAQRRRSRGIPCVRKVDEPGRCRALREETESRRVLSGGRSV